MTADYANSLDLSVIVPVRDEEENIAELVGRLTTTIDQIGLSYELIFVTDTNTDRTLEVLKEAHQRNPQVKVIKLSNSFGQHIAAVAGLDVSRGDAVVLMDGDLQDHPEDIPKLYERMQQGFDVVYGIKRRKDDSRVRNLLSKAFLATMNRLCDHKLDHNTSMFRIMSRRTVNELRRFRESEQSLTGLVALIGFPTDKVPVTSGCRKAGQTKYSFVRQVNFAVSFLLSFSTKPLRMISIFGLLISVFSFAYLAWILTSAIFVGIPVAGWATVVCLVTFLGGIQLLALGMIGEYIGRIFIESKKRPLYIVDQTIGDLFPDEQRNAESAPLVGVHDQDS